jgi:hypothetical protein
MGTIMLLMGGGLFFALLVFFICEEKSLKDANFSDMKCLVTEEVEVSKCFEQFQTIRYVAIYFVAMVVFDGLIAHFVYLPSGFGILEIMAYTFVPSLMGSGIILLVKWTYQPVIKLISSFMFGAVFMGASVTAFGAVYFLSA